MTAFEQAWELLKSFRHKYGPVTHFHGARGVEPENPGDLPNEEAGRDPNRYQDTIASIMRHGLKPSEKHGVVFMAPLREAHGYSNGRPLFGVRTEGLDLGEGHMFDAHGKRHTIHEGAIDPERLTLISPNTYHENVHPSAIGNPSSLDYVDPRDLPEGGLRDSFSRPRLSFNMDGLE
tara:strand:+ start:10737 stop:11267 length:531 start_codon:yes stop_codon:yes gene_type:complete